MELTVRVVDTFSGKSKSGNDFFMVTCADINTYQSFKLFIDDVKTYERFLANVGKDVTITFQLAIRNDNLTCKLSGFKN